MSPRYTLNKEDVIRMLKVLGWTLASTAVATLITLLAELEVPKEYTFLLPVVNTLLVGLHSFLRGASNQSTDS